MLGPQTPAEWRDAIRVWKDNQKVEQGWLYTPIEPTEYHTAHWAEEHHPRYYAGLLHGACAHPAWPEMMQVIETIGLPPHWPWDLLYDATSLDGKYPGFYREGSVSTFYWGVYDCGTHLAVEESGVAMINQTFGLDRFHWYAWNTRFAPNKLVEWDCQRRGQVDYVEPAYSRYGEFNG